MASPDGWPHRCVQCHFIEQLYRSVLFSHFLRVRIVGKRNRNGFYNARLGFNQLRRDFPLFRHVQIQKQNVRPQIIH